MNIDEAINYCLSKKSAIKTYPFDEKTLVIKLGSPETSKMFALVYEKEGQIGLNLKCDPELALVLRSQYEGVFAGYHMNKKHWNTVLLNSDVPDHEIYKFIDISYDIVLNYLSKKLRLQINS